MKYIPADKLIAEIERLTNQKKEQLKKFSDEDYCCSVASHINCELGGNLQVLSIIKSLQQEQPEVDLNSALTGFMGRYAYENSGEYPSAIDIARHFYELGLNARKEE